MYTTAGFILLYEGAVIVFNPGFNEYLLTHPFLSSAICPRTNLGITPFSSASTKTWIVSPGTTYLPNVSNENDVLAILYLLACEFASPLCDAVTIDSLLTSTLFNISFAISMFIFKASFNGWLLTSSSILAIASIDLNSALSSFINPLVNNLSTLSLTTSCL